MSYDTKCFDLAELFLEDEPTLNNERRRKELAQTIQDAIEGYVTYERDLVAKDPGRLVPHHGSGPDNQ